MKIHSFKSERSFALLSEMMKMVSAWRSSRLFRALFLLAVVVGVTVVVGGWPTLRSAWQAYRAERGLRNALRSENRAWVNAALKRVGPERAVPALASALKDQDAGVRRRATYLLGRIGDQAEAVVPALIEALKDQDFRVRADAAEALGEIGASAMPAVPELVKALADENGGVRVYAGVALKKIDPSAAAKARVP